MFEYEEKNYYKPIRVGNIWSNDYLEYESSKDKIKHYKLKYNLIKSDHT